MTIPKFPLLWAVALIFTSPLMAKNQGDKILMTIKSPGLYQDGAEVRPWFRKTLRLSRQKQQRFHVLDSQYGKKMHYKGVRILDLLKVASSRRGADTVLLHFKNGMLIPVVLRSLERHPDKLLVVTRVRSGKSWSTRFPKVAKKNPYLRDPRPLTFQGNKVVASDPAALLPRGSEINPFRYGDSLVGLELVVDQAWGAQFAGASRLRKGLTVFQNRCRFCHGVRSAGADYGWDFVDPLPLWKKRDAQSLLFHVQLQKNAALESGLMMPQQKDMTPGESKAIWLWMKDLERRSLKSYRP